MNGFRFQDPQMLQLLWLLPFLGLLLAWAERWRGRVLARFASEQRAAMAAARRPLLRGGLLLGALILLVIGLARPAWEMGEVQVKRQGRDVVFMLDVSRSMLAEDLAPNRLERAKLAISDCIEQLDGDRVALVAFAGRSVVRCPLTLDYGFFRMVLEETGVESAGRGGSMIGDGLRTVLSKVFDQKASKYRDVVLITDGEDQESMPLAAAREAGEKGVRLLVVGLGDQGQGGRIPLAGQGQGRTFLQYQGREVWSRLDGKTLRAMALATPGGRYLPVGTGTIDLGQVYRDLIAGAAKSELGEMRSQQYEEEFQIFIGLALLLLAVDLALAGRAGRRRYV